MKTEILKTASYGNRTIKLSKLTVRPGGHAITKSIYRVETFYNGRPACSVMPTSFSEADELYFKPSAFWCTQHKGRIFFHEAQFALNEHWKAMADLPRLDDEIEEYLDDDEWMDHLPCRLPPLSTEGFRPK